MANFNLDLIGKALPKIVAKTSVEAPVDSFLQDVLFAGSILGSEGVDGVEYDWRKSNPTLTAESLRGIDPDRANYKTGFNANYVVPNYYHLVDEVGLAEAENRVFGEDVGVNVDTHDRVTRIFSDKVQGIKDGITMAKERMCSDAIFTAQVVNKSGTQTFPMTNALLSQSGANLTTQFESVISAAYKATRAKNKNFRATALVMNPDNAMALVTALGTLINRETYALGNVAFGQENKGAVLCGTVNTPAGTIAIYAYYGADATGNYIPSNKAILCGGKIGSMAYGRVRAYENGLPCYRVQAERMTAYQKGLGDMAHYEVEYQTAPLPVITAIDGYCVLTNIS